MADKNSRIGHRERLRKRFLSNPESFSDSELLELILTYTIPRRYVAPLVDRLLLRFGDIAGVFSASSDDLCNVNGVGEQAAILINAISKLYPNDVSLTNPSNSTLIKIDQEIQQPKLIDVEPELGPLFEKSKEPKMRTFTNDEILNSLEFIPKAAKFNSLDAYQTYLEENLPYNSVNTRKRRARNIINRYFSDGIIHTPFVYWATHTSSENDLKYGLFYELLKAEPIAAQTAQEFVWPALPIGYVDREVMRDFIASYLPDLKFTSQSKVVKAIYNTYELLSIGKVEGDLLYIHVHRGTLEGFLYIFTSEYSVPGVYSFDSLNESPARHWLLWDKEWIRQQLYNLQDFGIIAKISEIDTVRQFTTQLDQMTALRTYFEHPQRGSLSIREREL
jgi:DNA repair protein RadC